MFPLKPHKIKSEFFASLLCSGLFFSAPAYAQFDEPLFADIIEPEDEVVAQGQRQTLTAITDIIPDVSFGAGDIQSLGVTDIGQLIDAINAEVGSDENGPPILLLDGVPVESRRDVRRFPSEAIHRVDVLPPEASLKFSSSPDRRVLNFVLRQRFNALTQNGHIQTTTEGGQENGGLGVNYLRIRNKTRFALSADFNASDSLSEFERDIELQERSGPFAFGGNITAAEQGNEIDPNFSALIGEPVSLIGVPDSAANSSLSLEEYSLGANTPNLTNEQRFRDLEAGSQTLTLGASLFRPLNDTLSIQTALNAEISQTESNRGLIRSSFDIPASNPFSPFAQDIQLFRADGPLTRDRNESDIEGNIGLFANYGKWRWSLNAQYEDIRESDRTLRSLDTDTLQTQFEYNDPALNPFGDLRLSDISETKDTQKTARLKGLVSGQFLQLPAGPLNGSLGFELSDVDFNANTEFDGTGFDNEIERWSRQIRAELDIPILGRENSGRRSAGRLSARISGALDEVENVGTLETYGAGLNWNATDKLRLQGSIDINETPPSLGSLSNPIRIEPNIRITDFATGASVFVDRLSGGNPALLPERRHRIRLKANYRHDRDLRFSTQYTARRLYDDIRSFPFLTPQITNSFADRLERDENGAITLFDARPVNVFFSDRETLRTGVNWTKRIARSNAAQGTRPQTNERARTRQNGRRNRPRSDRLTLSLYHTLRIKDEVQFRENGEVLDLLGGAALSRRGGQPVHEIEGRINLSRANYGGGLFVIHESGKTLDTSFFLADQEFDNLMFSPVTKTNLRLYYDLGRTAQGRRVSRKSWRRDLRVTLDIDNIDNQRTQVTSENGDTPFGYEPDALDPTGRTVKLSLRKMFSSRPRRAE